ncbi:uncharacterized protein AMSG_02372 [Thecamonas trahens ATCC 50062]|uniref:ER membrane protein complex subunit 4 n=1 Tax=Thecamonas trahens ATCC 50062 TaxID=461836 RepID=A0A0L0DWE0_THETB|nr:hypothetical protein AMSG_02372 [Thecamonas trahens ATCC 50062]KNC56401.1 hypothetical protein AMSG_02372 [Thecamonas trahens ATCC 50062]|eukprot:XP_013760914.1 hypothetical protein AMSG_02372 [Thecamonas trahens ATCC 50062]
MPFSPGRALRPPPGLSAVLSPAVAAALESSAAAPRASAHEKKAWELAMSPVKGFFMTGFMLWMSGSSVGIFSMMMTYMALSAPVSAMMNVSNVFKGLAKAAKLTTGKEPSFLLQKIAYLLLQCVALALGLWKLKSLGLLPTKLSDLFGHMNVRHPLHLVIPADLPAL